MSSLSFQEKSVLGSMLAVAIVSAWYFSKALGVVAGGAAATGKLAVFGIGMLIALIVIEIVYHAIIAAASPEEAHQGEDERDRLIALKGARNGGVILATGVTLIIGHVLFNAWSGRDELVTPFIVSHLLLFALVVAQLTEYLSQLFHYRRGV